MSLPTSTTTPGATAGTVAAVAAERRGRHRRWWTVIGVLTVLVIASYLLSLCFGHTFYQLGDVWRVIVGDQVPGASYTVGNLRLPRASLALACGLAFGLGGVVFQTMLRNPLASPDIIGISSAASAAAVFSILTLSLSSAATSAFAIAAALAVAVLVFALAWKGGVAGTRLILVGIGVSAILTSLTNWQLSTAQTWDTQEAMRWLTGSLNNASWGDVRLVLVAVVVLTPVLLAQWRNLAITQLGDDTAEALGVRVSRTRLILVVAAVGLIAFATAAAGPIAFVAFLSGPIAARLVGQGTNLLVPAALVGALLVLVADFAGQWLFDARYPVGVVTGVLGAPYLIYLIIRTNRAGGSL
ncbi:FecCD family ABC transporter permease [Candidatus Corynebacterium faecigallinarum]|uniref:FecCD family ABC transporter permease n=1 Tax=Candidatus Corynebacterium faecigallinarum TaxID=2838528 RepID=UPI003FCF1758